MSDTPNDGTFRFAMGEFDAFFPTDLRYAKNHMWGRCHSESRWRFGLSSYAVRLLQDVYFLEWELEPPAAIAARQMIGAIESKKAESDLYSPVAGTLTALNEEVLSDPSLINADCYEAAWLIELTVAPADLDVLLDPDSYRDHLTEAWKVAQKTIRGQANA